MTNLQQQCERRANECYRVAQLHLGRGVKRIPIEYSNRMTKTAGKFTFKGNEAIRIRLSNVLLELNPEEFIKRTVGHEVAHHIVHSIWGADVQAHGREWKKVMSIFGQEASRCNSMETVKSKEFEYIVDGKSNWLGKIQHGRCQRGTVYTNKAKDRITADNWVGNRK